MPWLCYLKHNWLYIDGERRRTCLRRTRYQYRTVWEDMMGGINYLWHDSEGVR